MGNLVQGLVVTGDTFVTIALPDKCGQWVPTMLLDPKGITFGRHSFETMHHIP